VREYGRDGEAAGALDVHEERAGAGDEGLCLLVVVWEQSEARGWTAYLEFVLARLSLRAWVQKIDCEDLGKYYQSCPGSGVYFWSPPMLIWCEKVFIQRPGEAHTAVVCLSPTVRAPPQPLGLTTYHLGGIDVLV